jgi:AcrR family transcriptional regulator
MGVAERRSRQRTEREGRIVAIARAVAEREGWSAVTVRRLAAEIEHSQPVLYSHFANRDAIVGAVAVTGFRELASLLRAAAAAAQGQRDAVHRVAIAYLTFALRHPALYDAMFVLPTGLRFAETDTRPELREAFASLAAVVTPFCEQVDVATETFWAALHGLAELEKAGRIRPAAHLDRVEVVVTALTKAPDVEESGP